MKERGKSFLGMCIYNMCKYDTKNFAIGPYVLRLRDTILSLCTRDHYSPCKTLGCKHLNLSVGFHVVKSYETVYKVCSNSAMIGAEPDVSTFCLARSKPELWVTVYNDTAKSRLYCYFVDSQAKTE